MTFLTTVSRPAAAGLAVAAIGLAGCGSSSSSTGASTTTAATASTSTAPPAGAPDGGGPGQGTPVVGPAAAKVKAAALAKYPGTIQIIEQQSDGSYVAHVIRPGKGEIHVLVSKAFKVTGTQSGPADGGPGQGTPIVGPDAAKVKAAALAKYPGTIQIIERLSDGTYLAHVIRPNHSEVHVHVSKSFVVTGVDSGPPGQ